ncbi:MAG: 16S rRNA (guanine(527)-N(7))-methyltransferase RsmG [Planctomycetota bacterium]|jgi:16S rRNA (guanine527-N7)-methyltransferase
MKPENQTLLKDGLADLGLELSADQITRMVGYHDFLHQRNQQMNLTGIRDERDSVIKNLLNSLAPWRNIDASSKTADIGTGGGLPGIPLGIALEMPELSLVESKEKKCVFLREACERFLPSATVMQTDVNMVKDKYDQIVSSALGTLDKLLRITERMQKRGTKFVIWKGRQQRVTEEISMCPRNRRRWTVEPFDVPELPDTERHICTLTV